MQCIARSPAAWSRETFRPARLQRENGLLQFFFRRKRKHREENLAGNLSLVANAHFCASPSRAPPSECSLVPEPKPTKFLSCTPRGGAFPTLGRQLGKKPRKRAENSATATP